MAKPTLMQLLQVLILLFTATSIANAQEPSLSETLNWLGDKLVGEDYIYDFAYEDCTIAIDHLPETSFEHWTIDNFFEYKSKNHNHYLVSISLYAFYDGGKVIDSRLGEKFLELAKLDAENQIQKYGYEKNLRIWTSKPRIYPDTFVLDLRKTEYVQEASAFEAKQNVEAGKEDVEVVSTYYLYNSRIIIGTAIKKESDEKLSRRIVHSDKFNSEVGKTALTTNPRKIKSIDAVKIDKALAHAIKLCKQSVKENDLF